jgi:TatD DNase family protein
VTYPKNEEARRIAAGLDLDMLVVETDSPFLPPHGRRGERNEPAFVLSAVSEIARVRGITVENAASVMAANARRLFGIPATQTAVPA